MLPEGHSFKFVKYDLEQNNLQELKFCLETRVNIDSPANVKQFLSLLNDSTGCTFNVQTGRPDNNKESHRSKMSGYRKCSMNVACSAKRKELQPGKNTNCGARINFRLETPVAKNAEQRIDKENFPLWLKIDFSHNHSLQRAEFLKYRSVNEDTKSAFSAMYQEGFTPSTAHKEMKRQIREEYPESWPQKFADKSKLPSSFWCY